jgi:hypothetical protein
MLRYFRGLFTRFGGSATASAARRRPPRRSRPRLEALEDRWAPAALWTVSDASASASDPQSLRFALGHAQQGDTIDFAPWVRSIGLCAGLDVRTNVSIVNDQGSGPVSIDGGSAVRPFKVEPGVTASLTGLTITHGRAPGFFPFDSGGGIDNLGTLTLSNCTLSNNHADDGGGGINNLGTLTLGNCTLLDNIAGDAGGGIFNLGTLTLTDCTLSRNSATASGPGLGIGGGISDLGTLTLTDCTLSGNSAVDGGGICNNGGTALLHNSIVADDIFGTVAPSSSYNLIGTGGSGGLSNGVNHNLVGVSNVGLADLADNGGPTQTMAVLLTSPALGGGDPALEGSTDQRGIVRTGPVDIGAYQDVPLALPSPAIPDLTYNVVYGSGSHFPQPSPHPVVAAHHLP